jgi:NitT/TauT family transport system permease protein
VVIGISVGSLRSVEAALEAPIGFMRYVPATALTPLLLLWLGIGESPKITLIVVGTVFFNILMVADVARNVPRELLEAGYTLGAGRATVLRRIILRHSVPGIIDVARINLAAGWLMLVVAELLAAEEGLAFRIIRAQRFRQVDTMFAMLVVFGIIGVASDLALRRLRDLSSPWARP